MGLITKEVEIGIYGRSIPYYEKLGYEIPRYKSKTGYSVKKGSTISVKVNDLMSGSNVIVKCICDNCEKKEMDIPWIDYLRRNGENNGIYCMECSLSLYGRENSRKTRLRNGLSFYQWCINNNREDVLDRWDEEINLYNPNEILFGSDIKIYFKCPRNIHESEEKSVGNFVRNHDGCLDCKKCVSFEQWCIDNNKENILLLWDFESNKYSPSDIASGCHINSYFICPKGIHESELKYIHGITGGNTAVTCKQCNSLAQWLVDNNKIEIFNLWSENNEFTLYNYDWKSDKKGFWKCENSKHEDYERNMARSVELDFRCAKCSRENKYSILQRKVSEYLNLFNFPVFHEKECSIICPNINGKDRRSLMPYDNEMRGDFFNLIIETHGKQHYQLSSWDYSLARENNTTAQQEFDNRIWRDEYKKQYALNKGYYYLAIPYWVDDENETYKLMINDIIDFIYQDNKEN